MLTDYKVDVSKETKNTAERIEKEEIYTDFVKSQEQGFIRFINYINSVVDILKQKAKISQFIEIRARIKDTQSAIKNYNDSKLLDDVFGVEIICANEKEIKIIKTELERAFRSTRSKLHNKKNGYKAKHESYSLKDKYNDENVAEWDLKRDDVPVVECQFKTIEVELNPEASHHDYKKVNKQEVQAKLEATTFKIGKEIPKMWVSRDKKMIELSYKEVIQRIYPFVDITTIKEPENTIKIK